MTIRGVLLLVAVFSSLFPPMSPAAPVAPAPAHQVATPFGIPLPATRNGAAWQQWRQQVQVRIEARRGSVRANAASGGAGGIIETIAGAAPYSTALKATSVSIGAGGAVVQDAAGNLYIATQDLGVVLKMDSSSSVSVYAGLVLPTGAAEASGDGGPATSARLPWPTGLALDAQGNISTSRT